MLNVLRREINSWIEKWGDQENGFKNCVIAELGSGSGIISAHVSNWLKYMDQSPLLHISIDLNLDASLLSHKYYSHYNLPIHQITTSLFKNTIISSFSPTIP